MATGIIAGLVPAFKLRSERIDASRYPLGKLFPHSWRFLGQGRVLVIIEVALAFVLLTSTVLLIQSYWKISAVNPGFALDHRVVMEIDLPALRYSTAASRVTFIQELLERIRKTSGVFSAGAIGSLPFSSKPMMVFRIARREGSVSDNSKEIIGFYNIVSSSYFKALGIPIIAGRDFADSSGNRGTAIVSSVIAEALGDGGDPVNAIGMTIEFPPKVERRIVGVVGSVRSDLSAPPKQDMYIPYSSDECMNQLSVVISTDAPKDALMHVIRRHLHDLDGALPLYGISSMREVVRRSLLAQRLQLGAMVLFGLLAFWLAISGIVGVTSRAVDRRRYEMSIRAAVGARPLDLIWSSLHNTMILTLIGLAIGAGLYSQFAKIMKSMIVGLADAEIGLYFVTAIIFSCTAWLAALIAARKALHPDMSALLRIQ